MIDATRSSTTTTEGKSDFDDDAYSGGLGERLASAMRLKEGGGGGPPTSRRKDACVTFTFRVKFYTNWGENVVVCGKSRAMGAYDPTKGAWMSCEHVPKKKKKIQIQKKRDPGDGSLLAPEEERDGVVVVVVDDDDDDGVASTILETCAAPRESDDDFDEEEEEEEEYEGDELVWTTTKTMRWEDLVEYRYAVVDSHGSVILWDAPIRIPALERRTSQSLERLDGGAGNGENVVVEFMDTFERKNHEETLFSKRIFAEVVLDKALLEGSGEGGRSSMSSDSSRNIGGAMNAVVKPQPCEFLRSGILCEKRNDTNDDASLRVVVLRFQVKAMRMPSKRPGGKVSVRVTGSCQSLGKWDRSRAMRMGNDECFEVPSMPTDALEHTTNGADSSTIGYNNNNNNGYCWHLEVACASNELPVRYKYEIWDDDIEQVIECEEYARTIGIDWDLEKCKFEEEQRKTNTNNNQNWGEVRGTTTEINDGEEHPEKTPMKHRATPCQKKMSSSSYEPPKCIVASDGHFAHAKPFRCAGVAVPVFSLRSSKSLGCGEFLDLKLMADFCRESGFRILQLLPVNDTRVHGMWWDSYPYSSLSVHALHPLYLRVTELDQEELNFPGSEEMTKYIEAKRRELQELKEVDYEETLRVKMLVARKLHKGFLASMPQGSGAYTNGLYMSSSSSKKALLESFERFVSENQEWLKPYAVFCALAEIFQTTEHWLWGHLAKCDDKLIEKLTDPETSPIYSEGVHFVYYLQWRLHVQLKEASSYLKQFGIALKGDLPIGVDKRSVDVWRKPELFRFYTNTGAPPDAFNKIGQNWKFPTYDWEQMKRDGNYSWWRSRLHLMEKYFSLVRVDHILGFFRIWELPAHCESGIMGRFRPSVPISRQELEAVGLWDIDRLTIPRADASDMEFFFGTRAAEVAARFFDENELFTNAGDSNVHRRGGGGGGGDSSFTKRLQNKYWTFKPEFSTEVQILECEQLKIREGSPDWLVAETNEIKNGLLELTRNVCLLRSAYDPNAIESVHSVAMFDKDAFYPRFDMEQTRLFQKLECWQRSTLSRISHEHFTTRQRFLWTQNAHTTIPAITNSTNMLVCGEDLGLVPDFVPGEMQNLGILGLRIQRMPAPEQDNDSNNNREFGIPSRYPYDTVCSPSCHDTTTFRAWFEEDENRRKKYYSQILGQDISTTPKQCTTETMRKVIKQHLESPSALAIFALADVLAMDGKYINERDPNEETINDPTNSRHYWRFRFHITLEDMKKNERLMGDLKKMVFESGRDVPR